MRFQRSATILLGLVLCALAAAQPLPSQLLEHLEWRSIGPFRGGRSIAVSGVYGNNDVYFMGTTGGGLYKTTDGGETWLPCTDGQIGTGSVGAVEVSMSNPNIVYMGMGEHALRGNVSHGDGIYRSDDQGETWRHLGLEETHVIGRTRIHPEDPDTVWVSALGKVWMPSQERGIYKTTDGGQTWRKVLFVDERSGALDICLDPQNPDTLYASTWTAWRTPYSLNSGGEGSGLWKSTDGGETWNNISRNPGLPAGILGKIGVAVSHHDSNRIYAIVEAKEGGVFQSNDAGATWERVSDNPNVRQRAFYYTRIYADPGHEDGVYVLNVQFFHSTDGGASFRNIGVPHVDNHDLWIDPANPQRLINGNDGGANVSTNQGSSWTAQDYATAQMYHVSTDNAFPYNVLGAQQDNSTVRIPSRTQGRGITASDWTTTAGGESGYVVAKPDEPHIVYGGNYSGLLQRRDHITGINRTVTAWPDNPMGRGAGDLVQRFQWTFPILFSPHDPGVMYTCSQFVLRSYNGGQSWHKISPDLTRADPATLEASGGPITKDNTGVEYYATVFALAESPLIPGVFWAGSDDGLVHVSQDMGASWQNVNPPGMPERAMVSIVDASVHNPAKAYLAVTNYKNGDFTPYIYRTTDYGATWTNIVNGIPSDEFVRVVREDPVREGLLFAGTEKGVYVSFNDGRTWQSLALNLPIVPIHDLVIKDADVVLATHGRSFYILDDISVLRNTNLQVPGQAYLFQPADAYRVRWGNTPRGARRSFEQAEPYGENPLSGVVMDYYLPAAAESVRFEFTDMFGEVFMALDGTTLQGMQRVATYLQYPSWTRPPNMILWSAPSNAINAPPGEYSVQMFVNDSPAGSPRTFRWMKDPRAEATDDDLMAQFLFARRVAARTDEANAVVMEVRHMREQIEERVESAPALRDRLTAFLTQLEVIENEIYQTQSRSSQDPLNFPIKLNNRLGHLFGVVNSGDWRPTDQAYEVYAMLTQLLQVQLDAFESLMARELPGVNSALRSAGQDELERWEQPDRTAIYRPEEDENIAMPANWKGWW